MKDQYKVLAEKYEMVTEIKEYHKVMAYGDDFYIDIRKFLKNYPHLNEFAKWFVNDARNSVEIKNVIDEIAEYIPAVKGYSDVDKLQVWADSILRRASENTSSEEEDEEDFVKFESAVRERIKDGFKEFVRLKAMKDAQQQHLSTHKVDISDF